MIDTGYDRSKCPKCGHIDNELFRCGDCDAAARRECLVNVREFAYRAARKHELKFLNEIRNVNPPMVYGPGDGK